MSVALTTFPGDDLFPPSDDGTVSVSWLGQAGFAVRYRDVRLLIDPYLSDSLVELCAGSIFPHVRMMPAPVQPAALRGITAVLCTHAHGDHLDPGTVPVVAAHNPGCRIVLPRAELAAARQLSVPAACCLPCSAGETLPLADGVTVTAIPAAHETLKVDAAGEHHFLGYILTLGEVRLYHSGDCVPFPALPGLLHAARIDVALLPVNGRDAYRLAHDILGNFTFTEAAALCRDAGIPHLIPHHFGLFAFNTVDETALRHTCAAHSTPACHLPAVGQWFAINRRADY